MSLISDVTYSGGRSGPVFGLSTSCSDLCGRLAAFMAESSKVNKGKQDNFQNTLTSVASSAHKGRLT